MVDATGSLPLGRLGTGSHFVDPAVTDWQTTDAPGFLIRPIFENAATGESTLLMKVEPGASMGLHAHEQLEEIFVLDGIFEDAEHTYGPGHYCLRAAGAQHTATSKEGCTVLLIYRP